MGLTFLYYLRRNRSLGVGLALLVGMIAFAGVGKYNEFDRLREVPCNFD